MSCFLDFWNETEARPESFGTSTGCNPNEVLCVIPKTGILHMQILIDYYLDKAEVTIQGTVGDNARYFLLSDGQDKTAETQIAWESESKSFVHTTRHYYTL